MRLASLSCLIPSRRISAEEIIVSAGGRSAEARAFSKLFGIESVAALENSSTSKEIFEILVNRLSRHASGDKPDMVIYVHGGLRSQKRCTHSMASLFGENSFFDEVGLFLEVDQHNCAGLFWALDIAQACLAAGKTSRVAIFAGDSLSALPISLRYVPACTLIGDAFVGLILDRGTDRVQLHDVKLNCRPEFFVGLGASQRESSRFFEAHDDMVLTILQSLGLNYESEDLYPHNVNMLVWRRLCKTQSWKLSNVRLDLLPHIGHCYTTDPFLMLYKKISTSIDVASGVLLSMGLGAYVGACRFTLAKDFAKCIS